MTELEPKVNFGNLTDQDIANIGLNAAEAAFKYDVATGLTNNDSLAIVVGVVDVDWQELGHRNMGPQAEEFVKNIDPQTGKLSTALGYQMDSVVAYDYYGSRIPGGAPRYTGGVLYVARVKTAKGWMRRTFAGAASGVQGHIDMATTYSALTRMGALWALKMQVLYGKAS